MKNKKRLVVLTGAGMSAESGLAVFRGNNGLWSGYRIEDVATPEGWYETRNKYWTSITPVDANC